MGGYTRQRFGGDMAITVSRCWTFDGGLFTTHRLLSTYQLLAFAVAVASNIGAGCVDTQHVALSLGTSGALRVVIPGTPDHIPDGLFAYRVDESRSLIGGALSGGGNHYAWLGQLLQESRLTASQELV